MTDTNNSNGAVKSLNINVDTIAGATSGMLLAHLAQVTSNGDVVNKPWIVILAPVFTLFIKHCWGYFEPDVIDFLKDTRTNAGRVKFVKWINTLLNDPTTTEDLKDELSDIKQQVKIAAVVDAYKSWRAIATRNSKVDR